MPRYAAFLRGMNLGNRRISNADLRAAFEGIGFADVATFRASGNVVLDSDERDVGALRKRIEAGLADALGYAVPTFLRTEAQMRAIAAHEPFPSDVVAASKGKLQVLLLAAAPSAAGRKAALAMSSDEDRLALHGTELYWLPSGGVSESALDWRALDAAVGTGTQRTKGTLDLVVARHFTG